MAKTVIRDLLQIFKSSVTAVLPEILIRNSVQYNPRKQQLSILNDKYELQNKDVYLVGTGKAVQNMAKEIEKVMGPKIKQGIISVPVGSLKHKPSEIITYIEGAKNNLPDTNAENTARKIKDLVTKLGQNDMLLVLISGGGSALLPLPKKPITLEEKTTLIKKLANAGADIKELNCVRKVISDVKGGQLAIQAQPAQVVSLILSDIVGDPLDLIASAPTVENKDDLSVALNIIKKYNLVHDLPMSLKTVLSEDKEQKIFPKDNVKNYLIGTNKLSINAALEEARNLNYLALPLSNIVTGNVREVAKSYAGLAKLVCYLVDGKMSLNEAKAQIGSPNIPGLNLDILNQLVEVTDKDICLVLGGEITVEVKGTGKGGRNQQLALEFSTLIHEIKDELNKFEIYLLSAGTDGIDGPTDAAGAIGYSNLVADATKENLDINNYLDNNDSYNFYKAFKSGELHVITGHTNTNVMDIHLMIIKRCK
ncbi:glycerate kinase [Leguminivora glycinivorella]|uniref:glycerate kinase n=1 Tax=Leguminivora glycinivorella TaxID=1035111 RepID=UPI00200DBE16|nr:glycerate kinase [Leguminivora glycinivorella]